MTSQIKVFDSGQAIVFDGNEAETFVINMRSTVSTPRVKNIAPGLLYTFIFHQDSVGGHTFQWPQQFRNAAPVDTLPRATSVRIFIGDTVGLFANEPGMDI